MPPSATQQQPERAELEAVLNSRLFTRAPSLVNILRYVCDRHFEGQAEDLKEYSIAVEGLGRPPDFDQKKDSIVRVEAHRLRRRLADYYKTEGAGHDIQIEIPNGQYAPRFLYKGVEAVGGAPALEVEPATELSATHLDTQVLADPQPEPSMVTVARDVSTATPVVTRKPRKWLMRTGIAIALSLCVMPLFWITRNLFTPAREDWEGADTPVPSEFRVLAGYHGVPIRDRQGRTWQPDAFYHGGTSVPIPDGVVLEESPDPALIHAQRFGEFQYSIPERPGTYEIHMYFADVQTPASEVASVQLFRVLINGKVALDNFDLLSDAGAPNRLTSRVFRDITPSADGHIRLQFQQLGRRPVLAALEVLWSKSGTVRPVRIVASKQSVTDPDGSIWMADQYALGGMLVDRATSVQDSELKPLFVGERFGNFRYQIPVPPGKYRVRLFFAETYFGSKLPFSGGKRGPGARVFNVFSGGTTLLRNFDVTKEAGGTNRPLVRTFDNLEPNAQGKIVLEFEPVRNYAEVNAIEVVQLDSHGGPEKPGL